jgi:hypothetical protein
MTDVEALIDWTRLRQLRMSREALIKLFFQETFLCFIYFMGVYGSYTVATDPVFLGIIRGLLLFGLVAMKPDLNPAITMGDTFNIGIMYILNTIILIFAQAAGSLAGYAVGIYGLGFSASAARPSLLTGTITNLFLAEFFGVMVITVVGAFFSPSPTAVNKDREGRKLMYQAMFRALVTIPLVALFAPIGKAPMNVFVALWAHAFTSFPPEAYIFYLAPIVGNIAGIVIRFALILRLPARKKEETGLLQ